MTNCTTYFGEESNNNHEGGETLEARCVEEETAAVELGE